jgi:serine/threonine-protein kinase
VLDVGTLDERLYMAMELLDGTLLSAVLKERGRLPLEEALPLVQQLAAALDHVHARGVIHRDVKPGNVILCGTRAVLTDFGLARANDGRSQLTTGLAGTLDYAAPEQILVSRDIDQRADVYGLGVTVYQLLTGELPFKGGVGNVLFAHLHQPAPDLRAIAPHVPLRVSLAVQVAMSKDPAARYDSAGEFAAALMAA